METVKDKLVSHLGIKVEVSAGTSIETAFTEAIELSAKLGVRVDFQFNEVHCMAYADGDSKHGAEQYHKVIKEKRLYPIANSIKPPSPNE